MDAVSAIDRLVLGHMPMIGVSYQSRRKDEEYRKRFSDARAMRRLIDAAFEIGVRRFAAAAPGSSPLAPLHLQVLTGFVDEGYEIELIPCVEIPVEHGNRDVDVFRRWATYLALEARVYPEVKQRILIDPILNFREGWRRMLPVSRPYDKEDFKRLKIGWRQIEENLEHFVDLPVAYMEPGSETDFLAMAGRFDLIGELIDRIGERGFRGVLFGVHHAGMTIPRLDDELEGFEGYLTPLNPLGVMMFPTKASAEKAVRSTEKVVYAIKPLAGGRVEPKRAFTYVFGFDVEGCMVGAASVAELDEDFKSAVEVLEGTVSRRG